MHIFFTANCWTVDSSENKTLEHCGHKTSLYIAMQTGGAFSSTLEYASTSLAGFCYFRSKFLNEMAANNPPAKLNTTFILMGFDFLY